MTEMAKKDDILLRLLEKVKKDNTDSNNYVIPKFLSQRLIDYVSIQSDLVFLIDSVTRLIDLKRLNQIDLTIETSIWYSIIAIYGRCFTDASMAKRTKLEIRDCVDCSKKDLLDLHDKIMGLRHSFIAHRGDTENEVSVAFLKLPKSDSSKDEKVQYRIKSYKTLSPKIEELSLYLELFKELKKNVEIKIQKHGDKTHRTFFNMLKTLPLLGKYTLIK
jgi:hypothetical protein